MEKASIIIRCKNDHRVFETIKSIDHPSEIIVMLVPNKELKSKLTQMGVIVITAPDNNTGISNNMGLARASNECCIIMDSDTIFGKGYIKGCTMALTNNDLARGKIIFEFSKSIFASKTIATVRDYFNNYLKLPYSPGLAIRRSMALSENGFNESILWSTDDEFSKRCIGNGAKYQFIEDVYVIHDTIALEHDIKAAYRTGIAKKILHNESGIKLEGKLNNRFKSIIFSYKHEPYRSIRKEFGLLPMLYHFLWVCAFNWGYWNND